ncbi:MAG: hypothetical protein BRC38_02000, partial [Cyanobacteria bacterium QH_6_48_35]
SASLWCLKTGQATQVNQLAELSGYHRTTISTWLSQYRQGETRCLLLEVRPKPGRPTAINGKVRQQLLTEVQHREGKSQLSRITALVIRRWWGAGTLLWQCIKRCAITFKLN